MKKSPQQGMMIKSSPPNDKDLQKMFIAVFKKILRKIEIINSYNFGNSQAENQAGHLKPAKSFTERELPWAIFVNDDETVTLAVLERDKSASITLNEVSLGQMIERLKYHAT